MNTILESTQGDLTHSSTVMMWILAASAVLFLFGAGTFFHLAYRRWAEPASTTERNRARSSATRVSLPASGHHHQQRQP